MHTYRPDAGNIYVGLKETILVHGNVQNLTNLQLTSPPPFRNYFPKVDNWDSEVLGKLLQFTYL